jgi:hypothetical protein
MNLCVLFGLCGCAQGASGDDPPKAGSPQAHTNDSSPASSTTAQDCNADTANKGTNASTGDAGTTAPPASNASGTKRVFITSIKYNGNLGGIDGADSKCNKSAAIAMIGGTWRAWISNDQQDAVHRIKDVGPWYTVDEKTKMYDDIFDLIVGPLIGTWLDELGNNVTAGNLTVWTGTEQGKRVYGNCDNWTNASGGGTETDLSQRASIHYSCYETFPLLCVEQ